MRASFLLFQNLNNMLFYQHTILGILPSEIALLDFYLNQAHQDPEWVEYVRQRLQTQGVRGHGASVPFH